MKDIILTINIESREIKKSKNFIGINGENLQNNIIVDFENDNFVNGTAYFEYEFGSSKYYIQMEKNAEYKYYSIPITSILLENVGELSCQIKIDNDGPIFKSKIFKMPVYNAINAQETIPTNNAINLADIVQVEAVDPDPTASSPTLIEKDGIKYILAKGGVQINDN